MNIPITNVTVNDDKSYNRLLHYLTTIFSYKNFDEDMIINVYVTDNCDLIGFDSQKYRIQYVNNAHKLSELMLSPYSVEPLPLSRFKSHILSINRDLPF